MLRGTEKIKAEHINSFIETLDISKIRYFILYSKQSNTLNLNGGAYNAVREILGEDSHLPADTDGSKLDNLLDEENIRDYKSKIFDALFESSNFSRIIDDFNAFYENQKLSSRFIHKFSIKKSHLEEEARLIYWLWGYIKKEKQEFVHASPTLLDKYKDIISYLSVIDHSPGFAINELEKIYLMYKNNLNEKTEAIKFLNKERKNNEFLELKSDFVLNEIFKMELEQISDILHVFSKEINNSYYVCIAIFDLMHDNFLRENLIYRLSRKWSDKKHREKMKEKNIIKKQISLNKETSEKLLKIEDKYRCNSSETIARLIENEYHHLFDH
ncbi:hypothetical protein NB524_11290 [Vibrio alginolyticus]|uniref:hypothetical protein n=1 Tax=Vibrio alginolyticus TaxID=663 RepID=UPI00215CAE59|nr:hypothetical protein [Vibrio alginolyticus]MCR9570927.1 hypothetical protein [Vibrio alginolyticus]